MILRNHQLVQVSIKGSRQLNKNLILFNWEQYDKSKQQQISSVVNEARRKLLAVELLMQKTSGKLNLLLPHYAKSGMSNCMRLFRDERRGEIPNESQDGT